VQEALLRLAYMSVAKYCIVPMQDFLGLGEESRMNTPGKVEGNWQWRLKDMPQGELWEFVASLCDIYGRA